MKLLIALAAITLCTTVALADGKREVLRFDANGDGVVNIVDALFIAQYTVGLRDLPAGKCKVREEKGGE